jgi:AcrR family transcriptional regulator
MGVGGPQLDADGRTARRDRNRDAVLDAVLDLFAEDALAPSAAQVAERSGVSLRSVYRYFEDTDELVRAAIERNLERVRPLFLVEGLGEGPVAERAARLVASRLRLYDHVGPLMRATLLHSGQNAVLAERLATVRRLLGEQVEQMFAPELARRAPAERRGAVAVLDQLLSFESIEHLRRVRGLSRAGSANALEAAVVQLLA